MSISPVQLGSLLLFREFPKADLRQLASLLTLHESENGETILKQGTNRGGFYVVLSGNLKVIRELPGGKEYVVSRISQGSIFGHHALIDGLPRTASIQSDGMVALGEMTSSDFRMLMSPGGTLNLHFQLALARDVVRTLRFVNRRFTAAATMPQAEFLTLANIEGLIPDIAAIEDSDEA